MVLAQKLLGVFQAFWLYEGFYRYQTAFKMTLLVAEQAVNSKMVVIQRVKKLSFILVEYDTKLTDIWKTKQNDRC